jgi:hypothetical protein
MNLAWLNRGHMRCSTRSADADTYDLAGAQRGEVGKELLTETSRNFSSHFSR